METFLLFIYQQLKFLLSPSHANSCTIEQLKLECTFESERETNKSFISYFLGLSETSRL